MMDCRTGRALTNASLEIMVKCERFMYLILARLILAVSFVGKFTWWMYRELAW
jgi:hypothetical protein